MSNPTRIFDLAYRQTELFPNLEMFSSKIDGDWVSIKTEDFIAHTRKVSKGLLALGVKPGSKVGLVCESRYEWHVIDFAIQQIGAVVVAIYPNITDADYQFIFNDAEIHLCIVSSKNLFDRISELQNSIYSLDYIFSINEFENSRNWNELEEVGQNIPDQELDHFINQVKGSDLATLIYTSGTTGIPKGVMLSHTNMLSNVFSAREVTPLKEYSRGLTFLPPCHAYERMVIYTYLYIGITVFFAEGFEKIGDNISEVKPHIMTAVPRLMEKVFEKIMKTGSTLTGVKKTAFDWAVTVAEEYDPNPKNRSLAYNLKLKLAKKLVLDKFYEALGGSLVTIASGSASLQHRIARVLLAAGIPIYEGYGLTEASPLIAVNFYNRGERIGTVGNAVKDVEIKLADDGEILVKGPNVMLGYYKNKVATDEILKNGWLHTGDIGVWIEGDYLKIIDRKKEMFKISGGKYVVPQPIETKLVESDFIEQAMVVGDGQKFASAFIVPNYANLKIWAKQNAENIVDLSREEFMLSAEVHKKVYQEVRKANQFFGNWEQIKKPAILPNEFTIDGEELTPTLKMKRKVILTKYQKEFDQIYK